MTSADFAAMTVSDSERPGEAGANLSPWDPLPWQSAWGAGVPLERHPEDKPGIAKGEGWRESHWSATVRTSAEGQGSGERVGRARAKEGKSGQTSRGESNAAATNWS